MELANEIIATIKNAPLETKTDFAFYMAIEECKLHGMTDAQIIEFQQTPDFMRVFESIAKSIC